MEETMLVHECEALKHLVPSKYVKIRGRSRRERMDLHLIANRALWKVLFAFFAHFVKVPFHILKYKEEFIVLTDDFLQFDDVRVVQLFQRLPARVSAR